MKDQSDNLTVCDAQMQIHYYTLLPKHVKGSVSELSAFKFNLACNDFVFSLEEMG